MNRKRKPVRNMKRISRTVCMMLASKRTHHDKSYVHLVRLPYTLYFWDGLFNTFLHCFWVWFAFGTANCIIWIHLVGLRCFVLSHTFPFFGGGLNHQPVMILGSLTSVPGRMAGSAAYGPDRVQCAGGAVFESCHWMRNVCVCAKMVYIYVYLSNPMHLLQLTHRMAILGIFMCIR